MLISFQFQYGSIKRPYAVLAQTLGLQFQFQYGSIKSLRKVTLKEADANFNSNMVRLKAKKKKVNQPISESTPKSQTNLKSYQN